MNGELPGTGPASVVLTGASQVICARFGETALSPAERRRADAIRHPRRRRDFVAAHILVRLCAAELSRRPHTTLTIVQRCDRCRGPHGRPHLADFPELSVSLSHSHGVVAAAAGRGPVGVDVEHDDNAPGLEAAKLVLNDAEVAACRATPAPQRALLRQWVRKEAFIKAGTITMDALPRLDLSALPVHDDHEPARTHTLSTWYVHDWTDTDLRSVGSAVTLHPPRFAVVTAGWTAPGEGGGRRTGRRHR